MGRNGTGGPPASPAAETRCRRHSYSPDLKRYKGRSFAPYVIYPIELRPPVLMILLNVAQRCRGSLS